MMDEYDRQLCAEYETIRQAAEKVQDDEALIEELGGAAGRDRRTAQARGHRPGHT